MGRMRDQHHVAPSAARSDPRPVGVTRSLESTAPALRGLAAFSKRPGWRLIRETLRTQRAGLALGVSSGLLWTLGKISVPMLVRQAIDHGIRGGDPAAPGRWALAVAGAGLVAAT